MPGRARALEFRGSEANYGFYVYMDPKDGQDGGDGAERRLSDGEGGECDVAGYEWHSSAEVV